MRIQGITIEVGDLAASKDFYENVLGFQPGEYYEPTKWQPYDSEPCWPGSISWSVAPSCLAPTRAPVRAVLLRRGGSVRSTTRVSRCSP